MPYHAQAVQAQLFDLQEDPTELNDIANRPETALIQERLSEVLLGELYGSDEK